jgi:hypothetical protein
MVFNLASRNTICYDKVCVSIPWKFREMNFLIIFEIYFNKWIKKKTLSGQTDRLVVES